MRGELDIFKRPLLGALTLHVALVAALLLVPPRQPRPLAAAPSSPPYELALDVSPPGSLSAPALAPAPAPSRAPAPAPALALAPAPSSSPPPSTLVTTIATPPPRLGLALDGPNTFVTSAAPEAPIGPPPASSASPAPAPRTAAEANRAAETMLRDPSRRRERELGLGPEGPVLRALGDATTASFAPVKGRAVFRAIADGTGMIVGIEVVSCDGGRDGWVNAAELAREALKGKKLRLPSTATRAAMRIEIVSEMKMPSGHDPGVDVSILGIPIAKGDGNAATQVKILDPLSLNAFAAAADPVDIGAKAGRVVRTRLLDSEVL